MYVNIAFFLFALQLVYKKVNVWKIMIIKFWKCIDSINDVTLVTNNIGIKHVFSMHQHLLDPEVGVDTRA